MKLFDPNRSLLMLACAATLMLTSGCATLPQAGPTGSKVAHDGGKGQFEVVEVTAAEAVPRPSAQPEFQPLPPNWKSELDLIASGDVLSVTFYEVGVRVFSGGADAQGEQFDPSAKAQKLGPVEVDQAGMIRLPFVGNLRAAGRTVTQLGRDVEARLKGKSEYPQVMVRLEAANGSAVIVGGEVTNPGRVRLSGAGEKLLDVVALAGGSRGSAADILLRVERKGTISEGPFESLSYSNIGGMPMEPGDRVELVRHPRSYSLLGSVNRVNRYDLPLRRFSVVEALAQAGGPNEYLANPGAVFVFRFEKSDPAGAEKPVVYHLNMLKPVSYFLAQQFYLTDKDVIYVAGAEANQPAKLLQMIGQIFTPIVIARQVAN